MNKLNKLINHSLIKIVACHHLLAILDFYLKDHSIFSIILYFYIENVTFKTLIS